MDVLAVFPTVTPPGGPERGKRSASCATAGPRRSRAATVLALVAAGMWAAVWLLEQKRDDVRQSATTAATAAGEPESVTR